MQDIEKALADITNIRSQIAAGRMFKGFGPAVIGVTGLFAFLLMCAQLAWPSALAPNAVQLLGWWIFAASLSVIFISIEMFALSRRHHGGLSDSMVINAAGTFAPVGAAGLVIGFLILWRAPEFTWALPGLWQILIAIGVFNALKFLPKNTAIAGAWYFIAGSIALFYGNETRALSPLVMGIPFAIGQWIMAYTLRKSLEQNNAK